MRIVVNKCEYCDSLNMKFLLCNDHTYSLADVYVCGFVHLIHTV